MEQIEKQGFTSPSPIQVSNGWPDDTFSSDFSGEGAFVTQGLSMLAQLNDPAPSNLAQSLRWAHADFQQPAHGSGLPLHSSQIPPTLLMQATFVFKWNILELKIIHQSIKLINKLKMNGWKHTFMTDLRLSLSCAEWNSLF